MNTSMISSEKNITRRIAWLGFLSNISMAWKMALMAFVLFLGILGITIAAAVGIQSLRYQLSNNYDFMLVPIVAISRADTALANAQNQILQSQDVNLSAEVRAQYSANIVQNNLVAQETITRYDTEWVTTTSPEFTQALRKGGKLTLQEQELVALADYHAAFDKYQASLDKYLATIKSGRPNIDLANQTFESIQAARSDLEKLIDVNNKYADFSNSLAQEAYRQTLLNGGIVLVIAIVLGFVISYLITTSITSRLGELTRSAEAMQKGNLDQTVAVGGRDEVSLLGTTFNTMITQLRDLFGTLEQRVAARTQDLATVAEVGTATATILETDQLLQEVVNLTKERFSLYHSHIYLLDESGENLVLTSGAGEAGRQMVAEGRSIPLDREQSLVARAARERKGVTVNDVTQAPDFLPNPLLPNTRSELAVPMIVGSRVIGVFDVQSDIVGRFTDSDINIQTTLAAQVATSIQNVRSFEQSKTQADFESLVNTIGQKIQRATSVEDTLQTAIRELGLALGAKRVKANIGASNGNNEARRN